MAEGIREKQDAWIEMLIAGRGELKCVIKVGLPVKMLDFPFLHFQKHF